MAAWFKKYWWLILIVFFLAVAVWAAKKLGKKVTDIFKSPFELITAAWKKAKEEAAATAAAVSADVSAGNSAVADSVTNTDSGFGTYLYQNNPVAWGAEWLGGATSNFFTH